MSYFPTTPDQWARLLGALGVKPATAAKWAQPFAEVVRPERFNRGAEELDDYLAEILHESVRLESLVENLDYSAERIRELGVLYGPLSRWGRAGVVADRLAHEPEALAEALYGGRFGNREPGDGWRFRGQGLPMVTFYDNYARLGDLMGQDLTVSPELLQYPRFALEGSLFWWEDKIPDHALDHPDRIRKLVQGGQLGLEDTRRLSAKARAHMGALA